MKLKVVFLLLSLLAACAASPVIPTPLAPPLPPPHPDPTPVPAVHVAYLPLVVNHYNGVYGVAPEKPFWRRGAFAQVQGPHIGGVAWVTGLQTIVIRDYKNFLEYDIQWHLVLVDNLTGSVGELQLRHDWLFQNGEQVLVLIVPNNIMPCGADTVAAWDENGILLAWGTFPLPCEEDW